MNIPESADLPVCVSTPTSSYTPVKLGFTVVLDLVLSSNFNRSNKNILSQPNSFDLVLIVSVNLQTSKKIYPNSTETLLSNNYKIS